MNPNLECPIDGIAVNENKTRLIATLVILLVLSFELSNSILFIAILIPDFLIRTSTFGKFSYLGFLADKLIPILKIRNKPTDIAPKRFAAGVGFVFSDLILIFYVVDQKEFAFGLSYILILFAILESAFGICAGCYAYTYLKRWGFIRVKRIESIL